MSLQLDLTVTFTGQTYRGYSAAYPLQNIPMEHTIVMTENCPDLGGAISTIAFSLPGQAFVEQGRLHIPLPPVTGTIIGVAITCHVAPIGNAIIVDVNKNGTTLFTNQGTRPTIAVGTNASGWVALSGITFDGTSDTLTADIDQTGSSIAGGDIVVGVRFGE